MRLLSTHLGLIDTVCFRGSMLARAFEGVQTVRQER
jgi:hypothetical protein